MLKIDDKDWEEAVRRSSTSYVRDNMVDVMCADKGLSQILNKQTKLIHGLITGAMDKTSSNKSIALRADASSVGELRFLT